jgi:hypothetical protein
LPSYCERAHSTWRLEEALGLIARAKRRVAEVLESGQISEADFEDLSGEE